MEEYFKKIEKLETDLSWNIPERKQGVINVVGGNGNHFNTEVKISEFLASHYPVKEVRTVLPDCLKAKLPSVDNFTFLKSTEAGSFAEAGDLEEALESADYSLMLGDLTKNSMTVRAVGEAVKSTKKPLLLTRDTVDLLAEVPLEEILMHENLIFFASLLQLQKILHAIYYPKMLLLSQPLLQIAEVLHKFTLSYPVKIITLSTDQILLAENGNVRAVALSKSGYLPFTFWGGELVAKVLALNLYNPQHFLDASLTAILVAVGGR